MANSNEFPRPGIGYFFMGPKKYQEKFNPHNLLVGEEKTHIREGGIDVYIPVTHYIRDPRPSIMDKKIADATSFFTFAGIDIADWLGKDYLTSHINPSAPLVIAAIAVPLTLLKAWHVISGFGVEE